MMNHDFQKCVEEVCVENGWRGCRLLPAVVIKLKWKDPRKVFHYAPRYSEIREWLRVMVNVMGKEEVERELGVVFNEEITKVYLTEGLRGGAPIPACSYGEGPKEEAHAEETTCIG